MYTTRYLRPLVLVVVAAMAASVMGVVLASPAQTAVQTGTPLAWGANGGGQTNVPDGLTDVVDVAGGSNHSLALKYDGSVIAWGLNQFGQTSVPTAARYVQAARCQAR
jgi:alpha-tubulin suppressor-like RCC1 family protein